MPSRVQYYNPKSDSFEVVYNILISMLSVHKFIKENLMLPIHLKAVVVAAHGGWV